MPPVGNEKKEKVSVFTERDPIKALEAFPPTVFPIRMTVKLDRVSGHDSDHAEYSTPQFPVSVRVPRDTPYIPQTTVHFDNPVEQAPEGAIMWTPSAASEKLQQLLDHLDEETLTDPERLTLTEFRVAEIPAQHLTSEDGERAAKSSLFTEEADISIAIFDQQSEVAAHQVRDDLGDALPGESRTPLQLTEIHEVVAKPSMSTRETQMKASRQRYYTESEADAANKSDATPGIWKMNRVALPSESVRPLDAVLSDLDRFVPALAETDLLDSITLRGVVREHSKFHATEVLR